MAESGENGAVYFNEELTNTALANTIIFSSGDKTITSSTAGGVGPSEKIDFADEGYTTGMLFSISSGAGTTENIRTFTINAVDQYELTVDEAVTSSTGAGNTDTGTIVFLEADPGIPVLGFYNWTLSYSGDVLETTNFDNSSGGRAYIPGMTTWTVTADKYFQTTNNEVDDWVGGTCELRLFINYESTPSTGSPSQYWTGDTIVTGLDHTTPVDTLVSQSISFQGDKALTLKTQTDPWSCGIST